MHNDRNFAADRGLAFMGRVNAGISHELKNILATISETAGLMEDLVDLALGGRELDTGVLKKCCGTISDEIQRGFSAINNMNRFAHSVDRPVREVDVVELLELVIGLADCLGYALKTGIVRPSGGQARITTNVLLLADLLYSGLDFAYQGGGLEDEIKVAVYAHPQNVRIVLSGLKASDRSFPGEPANAAAGMLKVDVVPYRDEGELHFIIPETIV